jgi:hypothetical protein
MEQGLLQMNCQTYQMGGGVIHVNHGPSMREVKRESQGVKWCFHCRKRQEFVFIVTAPIEPDWYGPNADIRCTQCNTSDGDLFPGYEREWE